MTAHVGTLAPRHGDHSQASGAFKQPRIGLHTKRFHGEGNISFLGSLPTLGQLYVQFHPWLPAWLQTPLPELLDSQQSRYGLVIQQSP